MSHNQFREWYRSKASRPLILAHRGDSFRAPENTLEAAELGSLAGADGWELDVQLTRDGVPIVIHDESLLRTTDVARRFRGDPRGASGFLVSDFVLDEICQLDAGLWFVNSPDEPRSANGFTSLDRIDPEALAHYASGRVRIPTLAQALAWTIDVDLCVNVEIKAAPTAPSPVVEAVLREIRAVGAFDRVAISSFDHSMVAQAATCAPGVATGALVLKPLDRPPVEFLRRIGADALHAPHQGLESPLPPIPILIYTVNDAGPFGLATRLAEAGVVGLFTDDPASMMARFGVTPSSGHTRFHSGTFEHPRDAQ